MPDEDLRGSGSGLPLAGRVVVVTGAARGIGRALVEEFVREEARTVVALDRDGDDLADLAAEVARSGAPVTTCAGDVREPGELDRLVQRIEAELGAVDVFCSNAGVMVGGGVDTPDPDWQRSWDVNVMAHVRAARAVLPGMLARSSGAFVNVLSAAGFLCAPESAAYTVTKHAALGFSEWLAINVVHRGVAVCAVCPEAVDTRMLHDSLAAGGGSIERIARASGVLSPEQVAAAAVRGLKDGTFLVAPHPRSVRSAQKKWADIDTWIRAMGALIGEGDG